MKLGESEGKTIPVFTSLETARKKAWEWLWNQAPKDGGENGTERAAKERRYRGASASPAYAAAGRVN
jgi:hypothetical protein